MSQLGVPTKTVLEHGDDATTTPELIGPNKANASGFGGFTCVLLYFNSAGDNIS